MIKVKFLKSIYPFRKGQEWEVNERTYNLHKKNLEKIEWEIEKNQDSQPKAWQNKPAQPKGQPKAWQNKAILAPKNNK